MAKSERELVGREKRWLRCPQCGGEIERSRCMCDWCGAVVYLAPRGDQLRLEGVICFGCGYGNPSTEPLRACGRCGQPFAATCPGCAAAVPLLSRCCAHCGLSVEQFDAERVRQEVREQRERRLGERSWLAFFRWQVTIGAALVALGLIVGRSDGELRRPLVGAGALTGALGAFPLGLASATATRPRRREP